MFVSVHICFITVIELHPLVVVDYIENYVVTSISMLCVAVFRQDRSYQEVFHTERGYIRFGGV